MRAFKRTAIFLALSMLLSVFVVGFQVYLDLDERQANMESFVALAVKDAITNIQTTEEQGLNFSGYYEIAESKAKYSAYLNSLGESAKDGTTLKILQQFLADNETTTGDALFRPIQFGMTYVDSELFEKSFISSLQQLIDANYSHTSQKSAMQVSGEDTMFGLTSDNVIRITKEIDRKYNDTESNCNGYNITINISDPKIVELTSETGSEVSVIYKSLYGTDKIEDYLGNLENAASLGISTATMPTFYVYYDIKVKVYWTSATTSPLLNKAFLKRYFGVPDSYYNDNGYVEIPGKPVVYNYRYVLLN